VPSTLMISTSWSTPLSPGNKGWPSNSSAATQPGQAGIGHGHQSQWSVQQVVLTLNAQELCHILLLGLC
jgi:hypothetical protein